MRRPSSCQVYAVWPSQSLEEAAQRGAGLGLVTYGVYELSNWAVLKAGLPLRFILVVVFVGKNVKKSSCSFFRNMQVANLAPGLGSAHRPHRHRVGHNAHHDRGIGQLPSRIPTIQCSLEYTRIIFTASAV